MNKDFCTMFERKLKDDIEGIVHWHTEKKEIPVDSAAGILASYILLDVVKETLDKAKNQRVNNAKIDALYDQLYEMIGKFEKKAIDRVRERFYEAGFGDK